jgi:hypothetical protein
MTVVAVPSYPDRRGSKVRAVRCSRPIRGNNKKTTVTIGLYRCVRSNYRAWRLARTARAAKERTVAYKLY